MKKTFMCPKCGKETGIEDGVVRAVEISSEIDNRYGYNPYYFRIITKYYNVRFCKSCSDKMTKNHYFRHILWFIIPQVLCVLFGIITGKSPLMLMALAFTISILSYVLAVSLYRDIKSRTYSKKMLEKAREGGAMA
jgi:hypothetical protein